MNETTKVERFWEWVTTARKFTINLLFLLIVLIILFSILGSIFSSNKLPDPEGKALVFNPEGPIVEQVSGLGADPINILLSGLPTPEVNVRDVLFTLEAAQKDERIEHVILSLDNIYGTGQTVLYDVGQALKKLKDAGKNIVAIADYYDQSAYYLASFANEIILHPDGGVAIDGYSTVRLYYKSFIDKLEVTVNLFRVGKYKSAMEPYIRDNMSEADKEARLAYLKVLWDSWKNVVSENREIQTNIIQSYADNLDEYMLAEGGNGAKAALKLNLVDKLLNRTQKREYLIELIGKDEEEKSFAQISSSDYFKLTKKDEDKNRSKNKIAVVVAVGSIVNGSQPAGMIGGDSTARLIREAHEDEDVKAIVLRVDSGGGSAFASEVIREEILLAKNKDLKVIASMSNVAASGGYWISANADEIWASHDTITGSIGIFGFIPTFEKSLDKIGIHTDGVSTTKIGGGIDPYRSINPILARAIQSEIEYGYQRFIELVAEGRNMTPEEVDSIAQGRVWAGEKALQIGLIDNIGNLDAAIERAAELSELKDYKTIYPSQSTDWKDQLINQFFSKITSIFTNQIESKPLIKKSLEFANQLDDLNDPRGIYLKCLDCFLN
tara:strand:- start:1354 stop:3183 length:1830 start_codon:yes stop_codon:yes gene_type:complete